MRLFDAVLRLILTAIHYVLRSSWFITRPKTYGAHAVALTPEGKVILVKLRYAAGWRLAGGGRAADEPPVDAALRELREEIGMTGHGQASPASEFQERVHSKRDTASLVVVRDVVYQPRWSWEVEDIREAEVDMRVPVAPSGN